MNTVQRTPAPPPLPPGWTAAAMAIHGIRRMPTPMLLTLEPVGFSPIIVDVRGYVYRWDVGLDQFPLNPETVHIGTHALEGEEGASALWGDELNSRKAFAGRDLDPLLWMIGTHAFDGARASWLRAGDKYRLYRWPEFDALPVTAEQRRIVKTIAKGFMTSEKLAVAAKVDSLAAQRVLNALSLMGLLRRHAPTDAAPVLPPGR